MSEQKLKDRVAVVTGGASGIGRAITSVFARAGARLVILDVQDDPATDLASELTAEGCSAVFLHCDVSRQAEVADTFRTISDRAGPVDILVNNAGIAHVGTVEQTTEADFDRLYAVNVKGMYNCLKPAVEQMKGRGGVILNLASVASTAGISDRFAYSMTKGAVLAMSLSVARDYVEHGIRCNSIAPGRVHTPFVDGFLHNSYPGREQEMYEKLSHTQPIGRMGEPDEIAKLALFLCSDDAGFITGSNYPIDGGFLSLKM